MKDFKTYDEQIELLKSRGLIISDVELSKKRLMEENYYNIINGYKELFSFEDNDAGEDKYYENVTFEEIYALYSFDRIIRNIFLKPLLQVENLLKSLIAYNFSQKYGDDNYLKISNFDTLEGNYTTPKKKIEERSCAIQTLIASMQLDIAKGIKKKEYIKHYITKYGCVPMWVLVNCITLGRISQFYNLMKQADRIKIAQHWNIEEKHLKQYIKVLAHYRNLCAHDERLYDSTIPMFAIATTEYHRILNIPQINDRYIYGTNDLFSLMIVFKSLLPNEDFNNLCNKIYGRMESLKLKINSIDTNRIFLKMGFKNDWKRIKDINVNSDDTLEEQITIDSI